jgi:hypothetical protein
MSGTWSGPLFVVGASRSGTAMLRSALNRHSAIKLASETHYFDDLRTRRGLARQGRLDTANAAMCADYFRALDVRPYGMRGNPDLSPTSSDELISRAREIGGDADSYFEAYCRLAAERKGKRIWGEKTPRHVFRLTEIFGRYPNARAICMVRDPRAVVASYRDWRNRGGLRDSKEQSYRDAIDEEEKRAKLSYNIVVASLLWRATVNCAMRAQARFGTERVRMVNYEAVARDPEPLVRDLCSWLGVQFEPEMLHVPMHNSSYNAFSRSEGISSVAIDRWRMTLSRHEAGVIQSIVGRLLPAMGYSVEDAHVNPLELTLARAAFVNRERMGEPLAYVARRVRAMVGP